MFKEMEEAMVDILRRGTPDETRHLKDVGKVPHYLNLVYGFDPLDILRVKRLDLKGLPDILLVLAKFPESAEHSKYCDYIMYEGKLTKIIVINLNDLTDEDPMVQMISISWCIWEMSYTTTESYIDIFEKAKHASACVTNIFYYAPAVLMVKVLTTLYQTDKLTDDIISLVINNFYHKHKILPIGVTSIRKAINEVDTELLLDYNMWDAMVIVPKEYPGAAFADSSPQDVLKLGEELKKKAEEKIAEESAKESESTEDDQTDPV